MVYIAETYGGFILFQTLNTVYNFALLSLHLKLHFHTPLPLLSLKSFSTFLSPPLYFLTLSLHFLQISHYFLSDFSLCFSFSTCFSSLSPILCQSIFSHYFSLFTNLLSLSTFFLHFHSLFSLYFPLSSYFLIILSLFTFSFHLSLHSIFSH